MGVLRYTLAGHINDHAAFSEIAARLAQDVEASEPETLAYEWFVNADADRFIIHEMYANDSAFVSHIMRAQENGNLDRLMGCTTIDAVDLLTEPADPQAAEILEGLGARVFQGIGGVVRV